MRINNIEFNDMSDADFVTLAKEILSKSQTPAIEIINKSPTLEEEAERVSDLTGCGYGTVMDIYNEYHPICRDHWILLVCKYG